MTPREYFQQCLTLDHAVTEKQNQYELVKASILSASKIDDVNVQSSPTRTHEDKLHRLFQLHDDVDKQVDELVDYKLKLSMEVNELSDDRYRMVLSERYFKGKTFERIAQQHHYSVRWVRKLHEQALRAFGKLFPHKFMRTF